MPVLKMREQVKFDPSIEKHRKDCAHFLKHGKWATDAERFLCEQPYVSVPHMVSEVLLTYYLETEFKGQ